MIARADMMKVVGVGAVFGFLGAVGIYFEPQEPYPGFITAGGTLMGITIALLITAGITRRSSIIRCLVWGACMGLLASASGFLAKGGWSSWDAPFLVPTGIVTGLILGPVISRFCLRAE
jgi:hypothetical protein